MLIGSRLSFLYLAYDGTRWMRPVEATCASARGKQILKVEAEKSISVAWTMEPGTPSCTTLAKCSQ